jgi:hypothetical protein
MKSTVKVTCCGLLSALAVAVMLLTNFPLFLYTVPMVASIFFIIPAIEFGTKWGFLCYGVTSVLSLVLPTEKEALIVFIGFLGYYPILKMVIERLGKRLPEMVIKLGVFNVAIVASYAVIIKIVGMSPFQLGSLSGHIVEAVFLGVGNVVFLMVDYALTKVIVLYFIKLRRPIRKILRLNSKY